jgi:hypothetical protein
MNYIDLPLAESAYAILLDARHKRRNVAADLVRPLRTETQNESDRPHEIEIAQAEAWLAICGRLLPCSARSLLSTTATYGIIMLSESGGSDDITRTGTNSSVAATAAAGAPGISRTGTGSTT